MRKHWGWVEEMVGDKGHDTYFILCRSPMRQIDENKQYLTQVEKEVTCRRCEVALSFTKTKGFKRTK